MRMHSGRSGFTLIELLVVIAIIAVLAAILFPVFVSAKAKARDTMCLSNLYQIGTAFKNYNSDWNGRNMPAAGWSYPGKTWEYHSFVFLLRKYVKSDKVFLCPSAPKKFEWLNDKEQMNPNAYDTGWWWNWDDPPSVSHYGNNILVSGSNPANMDNWGDHIPTESEIREPSRTIYLLDARWVDLCGGNLPGRIGMAKMRHHGGGNTVCCDGHSKWISVELLNKWPWPKNAPVRWDYR